MSWPSPRLSLARGIRAALLLGIVGAIAPPVLMLGITVVGWFLNGTSEFDRQYDLGWLQDRMIRPTVGCATLFAGAGWATCAPAGNHRFAGSLAFLFAISVILWFILGSLKLTPQRLKGSDYSRLYASELLVLLAPPITSAIGLSAIRSGRQEMKKTPLDDADFQ